MKHQFNPSLLTPLTILAGSLIIAAAIILVNGPLKKTAPAATLGQQTTQTQPGEVLPLQEQDHVRGSRTARILLIEYSDLECPYCKRFHPTLTKMVRENPDVVWVYRHFPIESIHPKAQKEAQATECAAETGGEEAFWKLTDKIFEVTPSNNGLDLETLPDLARAVGLDGPQIKQCLDSNKMDQTVKFQHQSGVRAGVEATPTTIILDTKTNKASLLRGAIAYDTLKAAIDSILK